MAIDDNTSYELTGYQVKDLASKVRGKADSSSLASVATSGLYSDLTGKPTIPTVNNGTLTIRQNGTTVNTFTANQSTDVTVDLAGGVYADDPTSPATPTPWVTADDVDWSTMPGYMHLVAIGRNTGVAFSTGAFIGLGCSKASGQSEIIDSTYAAFSSTTEDIVLQPGKYYITASIRFGDTTANNNVFGGITVTNSGTTYDDDDIRIGNWGFTNQRITVEANRYFNFTNTNGTKVRFRVWATSSGSASKALMYIYRIGD